MKKIKNLMSAMLMLALPLAFTACDDEVEYTPADKPTNAQVYFPSTNKATVELSKDKTSFEVVLVRFNTDEAITVPITATGDELAQSFTLPTSASFAQGADTAKLSISYDPEVLEYDEYANISLTIGGENLTTPYGMTQYAFEAGIPAPWTSLGKATFMDAFLFENTYKVELQRNDLNPNVYRLVDPYSEGLEKEGYTTKGEQAPYVEFTLLQPNDKINDVTITMEGLVYFPSYCTGFFNESNGYNQNVYAHHPSTFRDFQDETTWTYSKVLQYQSDGTPAAVQFAPYYYMDGIGGWDNTQYDGVVTIIFPGASLSDFSIAMQYKGNLTEPSGYNYALTDVTLGADVTEARLVLVPSTADLNAVLGGIIDESIAYTSIEESGEVKMLTPGNGEYCLVALTYGANSAGEIEPQEASYIAFTHIATTEIIPIEAYEGDWAVQAIIGQNQYTLPISITKHNEDTLLVKGALPVDANYDDTFVLTYNNVNGLVTLAPQEVTALEEGATTMVVPLDLQNGSFTTKETLTGRMTNSGIIFENTYTNQGYWTSFAYLNVVAGKGSLLSFYAMGFAPLAQQAQALSFKSPDVLTIKEMKIVKSVSYKTSLPTENNLFIRNLNKSKWENRAIDSKSFLK